MTPKLFPFRMTRTHAAVLGALLVLGTSTLIGVQSRAADTPTAAAPRPALTITTAKPETTKLPVRLAANGNIAAWQEASVGTEANGLRLTDVRVNVGDVVRAGQVLATFAPETIQADVGQARAGLMEAEANAADATANADRARGLQQSGALSAQQINQYLTAEQTARARVEAARATLAAQQLRMKNTQVLAPDSGVISARSATVGAVLPAGTELFRMIRQGRLEWRGEVTSAELGRIPPGTTVTVTIASGAQVKGKVRMIAPTVDPQTRNALVYVDLAPNVQARAGMFARGEFDLGASDALTVPQQAVVVRDAFSYVFRLGEGQRVSQVKVDTGRRIGDRVEILRGVDAGATVAVNGAGFLNDGDVVRVTTGAAPAAGNTPAKK
ncbi:efflux RND transporter periplasmic adaptor subunit [Variovorax sp. VNK109]|uniref:efflux RND transporter periplasmic adaptor subunit n=1 Tax=Variovorax sp. VNK109 TaxID=3400919 RepID=UPI003C0A09A5